MHVSSIRIFKSESVHHGGVDEGDSNEQQHHFVDAEVDFEEGGDSEVEDVQTDHVEPTQEGDDREDLDHGLAGGTGGEVVEDVVLEHGEDYLVDDEDHKFSHRGFDAFVGAFGHEFLKLLIVLLKVLEVGLVFGIRKFVH